MRIDFRYGSDEVFPSVVAVGTFDGVHAGHRHVIKSVLETAEVHDLRSMIATFEPHPREVLTGIRSEMLLPLDQRCERLREAGIDTIALMAFNRDVAQMSAEAFVEDVLVGRLGARFVVVGHDHRFGHRGQGDISLLKEMGQNMGFGVLEMTPLIEGGEPVSSSRIRRLLRDGVVSGAARLLGRLYSLGGTVIGGAGRGRTIGIPTANIDMSASQAVIPGRGVYAVWATLPDAPGRHPAMMNIGIRPTFDGTEEHLEVHVLNWEGDLYGREVRVEFVERIRDEVKFASVDDLIRQLQDDRARCTRLLENPDANTSYL